MTAQAGQNVQVDEREVQQPFTAPVTPLARIERPIEEDTQHVFEGEPTLSLMPSERELQQMMHIADLLAKSGFLPRKLDSAGKVLAVILTGRELGLPPMLSTRCIKLMKDTGLPIVAADVILGTFKRNGGRAQFKVLTDKHAELWLKHPNGDQHVEVYTIEDARRAGLLEKSGGRDDNGRELPNNWLKHPKAMLRSRCITAGLKSLGYEPAAGVYSPDEAEEIEANQGLPPTITATVTESGSVEPADSKQVKQQEQAEGPRYRLKGKLLDERIDGDRYALSEGMLRRNHDWALDMAAKADEEKKPAEKKKFEALADAIVTELKRRQAEEALKPIPEGISNGEAFDGLEEQEGDVGQDQLHGGPST